ncbi:MAG TPA: YceI family protein [Nocardioidaceae bacterium]|nr:YceI family protein [Nocardioidaceae bacterium]
MSTTTVTQIPTGTYTIDAAHSTVGFVARHAMVTKVRGSFTEFEGKAVVADKLEDSFAEIVIQVDSINTRNEQRDGHLRGNDFFDIANHPEIRFVSTSVIPNGPVLSVTGDLTIKGVSKAVTIDFEYTGSATDPFGNDRIGFEGKVVVNRKDWGVSWNAALEAGGVLVSEKVTLEFDISAIKAV